MAIFKVLPMAKRTVLNTVNPNYHFEDTQTAYGEYQYFSTLDRAMDFVALHFDETIEILPCGDEMWFVEKDNKAFNIYYESDGTFDRIWTKASEMPTNFREN